MSNSVPPNIITLSFGGVALALIFQDEDFRLDIPDLYKPFLSKATPELNLYIRYKPKFNINIKKTIFDSGGNWLIGLHDRKIIIKTGIQNQKSNQVLILEPDLTAGELICVGDMWSQPTSIIFLLGIL